MMSVLKKSLSSVLLVSEKSCLKKLDKKLRQNFISRDLPVGHVTHHAQWVFSQTSASSTCIRTTDDTNHKGLNKTVTKRSPSRKLCKLRHSSFRPFSSAPL